MVTQGVQGTKGSSPSSSAKEPQTSKPGKTVGRSTGTRICLELAMILKSAKWVLNKLAQKVGMTKFC